MLEDVESQQDLNIRESKHMRSRHSVKQGKRSYFGGIYLQVWYLTGDLDLDLLKTESKECRVGMSRYY